MFYNVRDKFGRFSSKPAAKRAFKKAAQKIKKSNTKLKEATPKEKRVMIAKDALKWLNTGKFVAESGTYCDLLGFSSYNVYDDSTQINSLIKNGSIPQCNVCAKGALFMSSVMKNNHFTVQDYTKFNCNENKVIFKRLKEFSKKQLDLVECFFEGWIVPKYRDLIELFEKQNPDDGERLELILKNIISNKGTFVPEKLKIDTEDLELIEG